MLAKHNRRVNYKAFAGLFFMVMLVVMVFSGVAGASNDDPRVMQSITVSSGDTLWSLVSEHYDYKGDIRAAIYEVKQINGLQSANLRVGDVLLIPEK